MRDLLNTVAAFIKRFLPWLAIHTVIFCGVGVYYAVTNYGADNAVKYYLPLLYGLAAAFVAAIFAYITFGREDKKYNMAALSEFDVKLICGHFAMKPVKSVVNSTRDISFSSHRAAVKNNNLLVEAVIDMHRFDFNTSLDKLEELAEKKLSNNQKAVLAFYTGRCYQMMGYPANAVKHFETCLELGMRLNDVYLLAARCLTQNGRFDDAIEYYNVLIERESYFEFIYTDIGLAYLKKGDGEKALEYFKKSVDEGMNYSFALGGCSLACLQMKDLEKSDEYYKEAVRCNMEDVNGFKIFYCNIAESVGLINEIDESMKVNNDKIKELVR
ncbi:MAG: tetratricopeptide repeat protein [Oscillospiraceae bacterium]|nr:tetratricopeptide repeat protein [Oscillospiraceae bacterium]